SINGRTGGTTASVLINDTLNGTPVNPTDVTLSLVDGDSELTLNANGTITIAPNTPAGTYELEYRICENLNPGNCSTAIATVTVEAAPILANPDDFDSINGRIGGTTASVLINDTLNGTPVNPADVTLSLVDGDSELTLNSDGTISIAPNTPSGSYELEYRICEILNPGNCSTAIATVTVEAAPILANPDNFDSINGRIGGTTASVLINDTLNGIQVNPTDVTLSLVDGDSELTLNANGTISIAPNTPAGTYELEYRICENLNPSNCSTAIATVTVEAAPIVANPDNFDSINGRIGGTTASVLINDTLNGIQVNPADVTLSLVDGDSELTLNADGTITIAPNTPTGTYELEYRICENLNPSNCSTAIATVTVEAAPIVANPDDFDSINGRTGGTTASVLINDTLNGAIVNPADITLSLVDGDSELTLNSDGTISIAPNTPSGSYELEYRICEILNPGNCSTAIATVTVEAAPILANPDNFDSINGRIGGTTASVLINDTLNGVIVNPADITLSLVDGDSELTLNSGGTISIAPNTPAGTYELEYRICENLNSGNCSTAIATVTVEAALIVANPDDFDSVNGRTGGTTASVLINDTLNGTPVNPTDVTLTQVDPDPSSPLTLNANGTITIAPNTPAGTYELEYSICENLNPSNCSTAIATVTVEAAPILANPDDFDSINGRTGGNTASVLIND
ncbi:hypothetical protein, partial [Belliella kenyensis]